MRSWRNAPPENGVEERRNRREEYTKMLPVIITLAWPTMLEQLMQTAVQYIDTAMVGALGTQATAAVGATGTVNWLINSSISALGVGFLFYISQAIGAGKIEKARKASAQAVMTGVIAGTVFTILTTSLAGVIPVWMRVDAGIRDMTAEYFRILYLPMLFRTASMIFGTVLRAAGDTKTPMKVGAAVNLINILLNFFLIYPSREASVLGMTLHVPGAGWGIKGAAAASAAAFTFGGIAITCKLWTHGEISPRGQRLLPDWSVLGPCLKVAMPNMLQRFLIYLLFVVLG